MDRSDHSPPPSLSRLLARFLSGARRTPELETGPWKNRVTRIGPFPATWLSDLRSATLYVPPGYDSHRTAPYPLLILQDGQNLFFPELSFAGEAWNVAGTADGLIRSRSIEPMVIVGIDNGGAGRVAEYTPTIDPRFQAGGSANLYGSFLDEQLIPEVRRLVNVDPDRTVIGGSSLGGLLALTLALQPPYKFAAVAALSPSVWWDARWIVRATEKLAELPPLKVWLDIGTEEGADALGGTRALRDALVAKGLKRQRDLFYREYRSAAHHEPAWRVRFGDVLKALFPWRASQERAG